MENPCPFCGENHYKKERPLPEPEEQRKAHEEHLKVLYSRERLNEFYEIEATKEEEPAEPEVLW